MTDMRETASEQALDWAVRTQDPEFDAWEDFTAWLECDPSHADAYHQLVSALADADDDLAGLGEAPAAALPLPRDYRSMAMAASLAVLAAAGVALLAPAFTTDHYRTAPGERRTITLAEGNALLLNGDTELQVAGLRRDRIELDHGQILLKLEGRPGVRVRSGDWEFVDIGTVFEVSREDEVSRLIVAEGAVVADPDGAKIKVLAQQMLETRDGRPAPAPAPTTSEAGAWEDGQLDYAEAPLSVVVADLRRSTGLSLSISPSVGVRRFSGSLSTTGIRRNPESLGALLDVSVRRSGDRWEIGEN